MLAQIRQRIADRLLGRFNDIKVFTGRKTSFDASKLPAITVHTMSGSSSRSPDGGNNLTTDQVKIIIHLAGDDNPLAAISGGVPVQSEADQWMVMVRDEFNNSRENLGKLIHRFIYTGYQIEDEPQSEVIVTRVILMYDAQYYETMKNAP